jgi:leucyl-tRNA---protein transferase
MPEWLASSYPAAPPPVPVELTVMPPHPCSYLPDRQAQLRAFCTYRLDPLVYQNFLDAAFRRSGLMIYQPVCQGCRACLPLRVPVQSFNPTKSQKRCSRRNADLTVVVDAPLPTDEKYDLYVRYQTQRHEATEKDTRSTFENFLYRSPVETIEFCYRDSENRLLGVGICDLCRASLSSVYFYFDPAVSSRSLGTYGALYEIDFAARMEIAHYYLGYWVQGCRKMEYKADFRPCEVLHSDGCWRAIKD